MLVPPKELEGILLVDKPGEHTSHDVVARLRGKLRMKRIGHAGTLDPRATGLLVVLLGKATRLSQYLVSVDKEYEGSIELGKVTDSQDADGQVMETRPVPPLTEQELAAAVRGFIGDQYQTPPMYSAIKIDGVPLYKNGKLNRAAFTDNSPGTYGNSGRNAYRANKNVDTDMALMKAFKAGERLTTTFRAEAFNLFNHPNFLPPTSQYNTTTSATFGQTTAARDPRILQFSLKMQF